MRSRLFWSYLFICLACTCGLVAEQIHHSYVSDDVWQLINPYLMPETHPLRKKLDRLFAKKRVLSSLETLRAGGFKNIRPQPHTGVIVAQHKRMKGYIFKMYTDDRLTYYRKEPEYITWMLRARGAKLVRQEIKQQGWKTLFKAPQKWIYPLPPTTIARTGYLQKNFILVEEDMNILPNEVSRQKWNDGTITKAHLDKLFYILARLGLRGGCKFDNIPICKDGRIAFIDTQNNLRWPVPYGRLGQMLKGELQVHWNQLIQTESTIPRVAIPD